MRTHDQIVEELMGRPGVRAEVERLESEEAALSGARLQARQEAEQTQVLVAQRSGTQGSVVAGVLIAKGENFFKATPEEEAMLVAALAQADHGETVPVSEVLELFRKR